MNLRNILLTLLVCLTFITVCAQGENDNWYFGNKAAVNFSGSTAIALNNNQTIALEASGTASDANGNLLFYTNSQTIWNRQHQVMQNGTGILGNSSSQQLIIVKNPANPKQYFVFVTATGDSDLSTINRISYSIVDMSIGPIVNGQPLGGVLPNFKNIAVTDNMGNTFGTEAITAIAGAVNNEYWLLIPSGTNLYSYKINSSGFSNGNPVISSLNFPGNLITGKYYSIKASAKLNNPNYSNLICISQWGERNLNTGNADVRDINRVLSFNSSTGVINNFYSLNINSIMSYLPEFNQNGSVLFLGNKSIYAIDLLNSTTGNVNFLQIYNDPQANPYVSIQRNKNGNIYINQSGSHFLGVVNNPNNYGSSMTVTMNAVNLNAGSNTYGLPQLIPLNESIPETYYPCIDSLTLISEPNLNFNYEVGNKIITKTRYSLGLRHNITMKAGNMVTLLPGTEMQMGANYHAYIAPCRETNLNTESRSLSQVGMILNLDKIERSKHIISNDITISPNPTSDFINIDSGKEKIISWELFDISGKRVFKGNSSQVNVQSLPAANYILKISTVNKQVTKKVTVK